VTWQVFSPGTSMTSSDSMRFDVVQVMAGCETGTGETASAPVTVYRLKVSGVTPSGDFGRRLRMDVIRIPCEDSYGSGTRSHGRARPTPVFDVRGRLVASLLDQRAPTGRPAPCGTEGRPLVATRLEASTSFG